MDSKKVVKKQAEPETIKATVEKITKPEVLGTIDLNPKPKKKVEAKKEEPKKEESVAKKEVEKVVEEPKKEEVKTEKEVKEEEETK